MAEVIILSDEEFYEMKNRDKRQNFLEELEKMTKPVRGGSFSVKDVKKEPKIEAPKESEFIADYHPSEGMVDRENSDWAGFVSDLSGFELSPIESVTDERITGFQLDTSITEPDDNKYSNVFKKELAMLSEVLKDVKAHGARVDSTLKKMNVGGKGSSSRTTGIPKGYSDLVEAYNSINTTKIQVIKAMSDLRSKQIDWQFKDKATHPENAESVDSIADMYYKRIIGGGTQNFIASSSDLYHKADFEYESISDEPMDEATLMKSGFNITQPIQGARSTLDTDIDGDAYGYIANEQRNYEIVAYQYGENKFQLGALDEYGEPIEDMELPSDVDPSITESLKIRPGSNFAYDKYGRSYRVVEMGSVDISDIDDMEYPY
jgi:hypothetical protein